MLLELNIRNFAIIDNINITFSKGLNVFTGETGAGKSIIIDAMNIVLGERASKEYIRAGENKAVIEALFDIQNITEISELLNEYGIENEIDNTLLISREIQTSGKSISRINGRTVTLNMLKKITSKLVDIHGQHEHQSLLSWENHISFIDCLGGEELLKLKQQFKQMYTKLTELKSKLKKFEIDDKERERKLDLLKFQLEEIDNSNLKEDEEENLLNEYTKYSNTEEILKSIGNIIEAINSEHYNNFSILDQLNNISASLHKIVNHDKTLDIYCSMIDSIVYQMQDILRELRIYEESISYNPEKLKMLEDRIDIINKLKRKYGNSIGEILDYRNKIASELSEIINSEKEINNIKNQINGIEDKLNKLSTILTEKRKIIGQKIENNITKELSEMNMINILFKVKFDTFEYFTIDGIDKIEFLISTNPGEPLKPLSKIVSGGEMSRIMLAFKSILAESDKISCLIFDEIDTGISGRTAQVVGEKMLKISKTHQILCVSHLPQIAAMASSHFLIEKKVKDNKTFTVVKELKYEERIEELSRLLGGVNLTDLTKKHAKEMLEMTKSIIH